MAGKTAERGYGGAHQTERKRWARSVARGREYCRRCGYPILAGMPWHLGHDPYDRSRYLGPMHVWCNCDTRLEKQLRRVGLTRPRTRPPAEAWLL